MKHPFLVRLGAVAVAALLVAVPAFVAAQSEPPTLTLYNGQHRSTTTALVNDFTNRTGIKVNIRSGEGAGLANQIIEEGAASPADVVMTENSPELMVLEEQGLLAKVDPATLANVPEQHNSPTGSWVGVAARASVLVYDPAQLDPSQLPASVRDLATPAWQGRGKIGIAPEESDFQPLVTAVARTDGEAAATDWLNGLKANAEVYNGNGAILDAVENGRLAAGLINHYYWFRRAAERGEANMRSRLYYFPQGDPGALVVVAPAGALASSRQPDAAQKFLAYLVSPEGQQTLVDSNDFEYPLATGAVAAPQLKPFGDLQNPNITVADLGDGRLAIQLLQQVGLL
jgi:iron(III) transport system substrate-binding protein